MVNSIPTEDTRNMLLQKFRKEVVMKKKSVHKAFFYEVKETLTMCLTSSEGNIDDDTTVVGVENDEIQTFLCVSQILSCGGGLLNFRCLTCIKINIRWYKIFLQTINEF